jgi:hypothetical protein
MSNESAPVSPLLVLARYGAAARLAHDLSFALLKLDATTVRRLLLLERLAAEHRLLSVTVDDVATEWDRAGAPVLSTWLNLFRGRITLDGDRGAFAESVSTVQFALAQLQELIGRAEPLHLAYPSEWSRWRTGQFELTVIEKLARQGHLTAAVADELRRGVSARLAARPDENGA